MFLISKSFIYLSFLYILVYIYKPLFTEEDQDTNIITNQASINCNFNNNFYVE